MDKIGEEREREEGVTLVYMSGLRCSLLELHSADLVFPTHRTLIAPSSPPLAIRLTPSNVSSSLPLTPDVTIGDTTSVAADDGDAENDDANEGSPSPSRGRGCG